MKKNIVFVFIIFFQIQAFSVCQSIRAAFDIGSAATKMKVALVDHCNMKIKQVYYENQVKVGYKEDLNQSHNSQFSEKVKKKGIKALKSLLEQAYKFQPVLIKAVAASAFRKAKNANQLVAQIKKTLSLDVYVISQKQEGQLGYFGALAKTKKHSLDDVLVWDIGGGSMQMTFLEGHKVRVFGSELASVTFKNKLLKSRGVDIKKVTSPNPLKGNDWFVAEKLTKKLSKKWSDFTQKKFSKILGIGSVHFVSIQDQVGKNPYTKLQVLDTLKVRQKLKDDEIDSEYKETDISNLLLLYNLMHAFKFEKVNALSVNLADGVLVAPDLDSI